MSAALPRARAVADAAALTPRAQLGGSQRCDLWKLEDPDQLSRAADDRRRHIWLTKTGTRIMEIMEIMEIAELGTMGLSEPS